MTIADETDRPLERVAARDLFVQGWSPRVVGGLARSAWLHLGSDEGGCA